jgi:hypothetical protein
MARSRHLGAEPAATSAREQAIGAIRPRWLWPALLVAASASISLVFACAVPFAALAVVAASTLPLRQALLTVAATWLANQALGYGVLGYPWSMASVSWGIALGATALISAGTAATARLASREHILAFAAALAAAFASYEMCLYLVSFILGGGEEAFAAAMVARIALLNIVWAVALMALHEGWQLVRAVGWVPAFRGVRITHQ